MQFTDELYFCTKLILYETLFCTKAHIISAPPSWGWTFIRLVAKVEILGLEEKRQVSGGRGVCVRKVGHALQWITRCPSLLIFRNFSHHPALINTSTNRLLIFEKNCAPKSFFENFKEFPGKCFLGKIDFFQ